MLHDYTYVQGEDGGLWWLCVPRARDRDTAQHPLARPSHTLTVPVTHSNNNTQVTKPL